MVLINTSHIIRGMGVGGLGKGHHIFREHIKWLVLKTLGGGWGGTGVPYHWVCGVIKHHNRCTVMIEHERPEISQGLSCRPLCHYVLPWVGVALQRWDRTSGWGGKGGGACDVSMGEGNLLQT